MCYVHNQWYDISCATLYFVATQKYANNNTTLNERAQIGKHFQDFDNIYCSINETIHFIFNGV